MRRYVLHFTRWLRAQVRDLRVLWHESGISLLLFVLLIVCGGTILHFFYHHPDMQRRPGWGEALHATFALIFFEMVFPLPDVWWLQLLFFLIPIVGLSVVADGVLRFGTALVDKQSRGQKWQVAMASTYHNHIIVCGLGKVGWRTCQELLKFGRDVVGVDQDENGEFVEQAKAAGMPMIIADARREETLKKAGIEKADAIVPATDDQMVNLAIALDARELNPGIKVVLRMFDEDLARRVEKGFGIRTTFSTSGIAAPLFAVAAMRLDVQYSFYVGNTLLNVSEIRIDPGSPLVGWTVEQLQKAIDLNVVSYQNQYTCDLHPEPKQRFDIGDTILVVATIEALQKIQAMNTVRQ